MKIDKNVPLPIRGIHNITVSFSEIEEMEVNDSVFFEADNRKDRIKIAAIFHARAKRLKMKFATRKTEDGLRIWRIE